MIYRQFCDTIGNHRPLVTKLTREYLCELRQQQIYNYRRYSDAEKLVLNNMVVIKDNDITLRNKWKKGVIDELIKGSDGMFSACMYQKW